MDQQPSITLFGRALVYHGVITQSLSSFGYREDPEDPASLDASTKLDLSTSKDPKVAKNQSKTPGLGTSSDI